VLVNVGLHYLEEVVDNLAHMLTEALTGLKSVNGLEHFNVKFDLIRRYTV